jgi:hypothetical protein
MKRFILTICAVALNVSALAQAESIGTIADEKARLLKRIQCATESKTAAGDGLGSLWGCYNGNQQVKLWINGKPSNPTQIRNLKLAVVNYHGSKMDITGKIWAGILADEYGGAQAEPIKAHFQECPSQQMREVDGLAISILCTKGPKADEHVLIVSPE